MDASIKALHFRDAYRLLTQVVIPRPIAWILSENCQTVLGGTDRYNLAPFSFFNVASSAPPALIVSIGKKIDGCLKDTRANLVIGASCVVHIATVSQVEMVSSSSRTLAYGESELKMLGVHLVEFKDFEMPRIAECVIALGCRVTHVFELGEVPQAIIVLEIEKVHLDEAIVTTDYKGRVKIDAQKVNPLTRLGADEYAGIGQIIRIDRPE